MNTNHSFSGLAKASILAIGLSLGLLSVHSGFALTCIWTGAAGDGIWGNQTNWSTMTVPTASDKVYITNDATFTININDDIYVSTLIIGGTSGSGTITVNWNRDWIYGGTLVLGQNAVFNILNSDEHILSGTITNYGRINWKDGYWDFNNGSRLENESGALVDVQCDLTLSCIGPKNSVINNAGTFRKSAGGGETDISPTPAVALNNSGTIDVESGTLNLYGSGTNSGMINVASASTFAMSGGIYWFGTNTLFTGTGVCEMGECSVFGKLQGPTMTFRITYDVTFNTELASGTMIWAYTPGNQYGPLTIDSNAVYNIGSSCNINGAITNWGTIVYPAGSPWNTWSFAAPARLVNCPGGLIDLQSDLRFYYDGGVIPLDNAGTLRKSGGTNESDIDLGFSFLNTGIIDVKKGTLGLNGITSSNTVNVAAGATVSLDSGDFYFGPTNRFTGPGVVDLNAWPACGITGPLSGSAAFQMDSDANFTNCILNGSLKWNDGTMGGILTVGTNSALVMVNSGTMSGSITNLGQINFNSAGTNAGVTGTFCTLSLGSNYVQGAGGALETGVGGQASDQYDQLLIGGTASLNGQLFVHLFDGFRPANGNTFQLLSSHSLHGTFSSLNLPGGLSVGYTTNAAKLIMTTTIGSLNVTLLPAAAAAAGALWQVDGGPWEASGTTLTNLWTGVHSVGFNAVFGWTSPANLLVTIGKNLTTKTNAVYLPLTNQLQIKLVGLGSVSPNYSNAWLQIGRNYCITSTPASGFVFTNWTVSTNWLGGATTNSRALHFTMASNLTLLATLVETSQPSLTITAPTLGQRVYSPAFTATGTVTDKWQVADVSYRLNSGAWQPAVGSNHWTAGLNLTPGTNWLWVFARNISGLLSPVTNVVFDYVVTNRLGIQTLGLGTISPNDSNVWLEIGRNYSLTAAAAKGFIFTNWTLSTNWGGGLIETNKTLNFWMASNLTLSATFVETSRPSLTITAPLNNQHISTNPVVLSGTTSDNWAVTNVAYALNGVWSHAASTNHWLKWNATLTLVPGTNALLAYAQNQGGMCSTTNHIYVVSTASHAVSMHVAVSPAHTGAGFTFALQLQEPASGRVEYSTDLIHWTSWTNFDATAGSVHFYDPSATNAPIRFYRAVVP